MFPKNDEWQEDVYGQERFNWSGKTTSVNSEIYDDIEAVLKRTARCVYNSIPIKQMKEMPETVIIAGIFLCRISLWYLYRNAQKKGLDVGML